MRYLLICKPTESMPAWVAAETPLGYWSCSRETYPVRGAPLGPHPQVPRFEARPGPFLFESSVRRRSNTE